MVWLLIIAGGTVALAFFLLMDLATLAARSAAARSAARPATARLARSLARGCSTTGLSGIAPSTPMKTGLREPSCASRPGRASRPLRTSHAGGPQPQGVADELPGLEGGSSASSASSAARSSPALPACSASKALLLGIVFAIVGFMLPDAVLTLKTRTRKEVLRAELPDALDLLAVSVEAGLGFDARSPS